MLYASDATLLNFRVFESDSGVCVPAVTSCDARDAMQREREGRDDFDGRMLVNVVE